MPACACPRPHKAAHTCTLSPSTRALARRPADWCPDPARAVVEEPRITWPRMRALVADLGLEGGPLGAAEREEVAALLVRVLQVRRPAPTACPPLPNARRLLCRTNTRIVTCAGRSPVWPAAGRATQQLPALPTPASHVRWPPLAARGAPLCSCGPRRPRHGGVYVRGQPPACVHAVLGPASAVRVTVLRACRQQLTRNARRQRGCVPVEARADDRATVARAHARGTAKCMMERLWRRRQQ